jgi:hypothetical protein
MKAQTDNTLEIEQIQQLMQPEKQKKFIVHPYQKFATRLTKLVHIDFLKNHSNFNLILF